MQDINCQLKNAWLDVFIKPQNLTPLTVAPPTCEDLKPNTKQAARHFSVPSFSA
jgi:hypothetical protein